MPLIVRLEGTIVLPDVWMDKECWEAFKNDREFLIEELNEDSIAFFDDCGGIAGLLKDAWWEEKT